MSLPRYPQYKDSGVEWLGAVPGHWHISKLKHFTHFVGGGTPSRDKLEFWNGDIPWVSPKDMKSERIKGAEECITEEGLLGSSSSLIAEGRVLMVVRSGILKHTIPVAINDVPVALNQDMKALTFAREKCLSSFFWRWVQGLNDRLLLAWSKPGATVDSIEHDYLAKTRIPLPPIDEQLQITLFLDRETAKIDGLMAEQEKLIALLKEKRQAVISHAVTKGLDPTVPMKDSGIEWLGEVPVHWGQPQKLLNVASKEQHSFVNGPFGSDLLTSELVSEGVPVVYIRDIKEQGYARVSEWCVTPEKSQQLKFCNVLPGDIIIAKVGNPPGLAAVYPLGEPEAIVTQDVIRLRVDTKQSHPEYIKWLLNSDYGRALIDDISVESTRTRVGLGEYKQLRFFVPPVPEQNVAADFLKKETAALDLLVNEAALVIDLLKERRTALISAAVTGQIDVRGLIKDEQEQAA